MANKKNEARSVIIIRETIWESVVADTYSAGSLIASIGVGRFIDSAVLQWISGLLFIGFILSRAIGGRRVMTVAEAREELDRIERGLK